MPVTEFLGYAGPNDNEKTWDRIDTTPDGAFPVTPPPPPDGGPSLPFDPNPSQTNDLAPPPASERVEVRIREKWGSPRIEFRDDGTQVTRELYVNWGFHSLGSTSPTYVDAARAIIGYPQLHLRNGSRYIRRFLPWYFPHLSQTDCGGINPAQPFLYATQIRSVQGISIQVNPPNRAQVTKDAFGVHCYDEALLEAVYETLTYNVLSDTQMVEQGFIDDRGNPDESNWAGRYITVTYTTGGSQLTLPQGSYLWANYGSPIPSSPGKTQPDFDIEATWHRVPRAAVGLRSNFINPYIAATVGGGNSYIPPIEDCLGRVNRYDFNGYKKGTLLLVAVVIKPIRSGIGDRLFDLAYRFKHLPIQSRDTQSGDWTGFTYAYGHNLLYWPYPTGSMTPGYYEVVASFGRVLSGVFTAGSTSITGLASTFGIAAGYKVDAGDAFAAPCFVNSVTGANSIDVTLAAAVAGKRNFTIFDPTATSNYRRDEPADGKNIYDYRAFDVLFRVPKLAIDALVPGMGVP